MNEKALGGNGGVAAVYWLNNTGSAVSINVDLKAKRAPRSETDSWYNVCVCVNDNNDIYTGCVMELYASSTDYFDTRTFTVQVPNGYYLLIWNNNDAYSIWTITYN